MLILGILHIGYSAYNPEGHDYQIYAENMKSDTLNDLPLSWALMKVFTLIFGNPRGLYILSFSCCMILYGLYAYKIENKNSLIIFTLCFFWLYPVWYLSSGVLRNLIGLCFLSWFILYPSEGQFFETLILGLVHIPTLLIYLLYSFSQKRFKILFHSVWVFTILVCLGAIFKGQILISLLNYSKLAIARALNPIIYIPFTYKGSNVQAFLIIVLGFLAYTFNEFRKSHDKSLIFWLLMLFIPFTHFYGYKVQLRFLYFTILPILNLMIYKIEEETKQRKLFLILVATLSLIVRILW